MLSRYRHYQKNKQVERETKEEISEFISIVKGYKPEYLTQIQVLLKQRPSVKATGSEIEKFALNYASAFGCIRIAERLLSSGVSASCKDEKGNMPFKAAMRSGNLDIAELLADNMSDVSSLKSALFFAIEAIPAAEPLTQQEKNADSTRLRITEKLLKKGAAVDATATLNDLTYQRWMRVTRLGGDVAADNPVTPFLDVIKLLAKHGGKNLVDSGTFGDDLTADPHMSNTKLLAAYNAGKKECVVGEEKATTIHTQQHYGQPVSSSSVSSAQVSIAAASGVYWHSAVSRDGSSSSAEKTMQR